MIQELNTFQNACPGMYLLGQLGSNRLFYLDGDQCYHLQFQHLKTMEPLQNQSLRSNLAYQRPNERRQK